MALIIEDGSGIVGAVTYQSSASIASYCYARGYTTWASLSTIQQDAANLRGMNYIESKTFKGVKTDSTNPLSFPRSYLYDKDGNELSWNEIPRKLKWALAEAARREGDSADSLLPDLNKGSDVVKREKIDVLEKEYFEGGERLKSYPVIDLLLKDFCFTTMTAEIILG